MEKSRVLDFIDEKELVELTQKLIRIPTENPPGNYDVISEVIKDEMEKTGMITRVVEGKLGKKNVFGLSKGSNESSTLLLSGHMDVVSAGNILAWEYPPYEAKVVDGVMWGRGTVDMKGAIAAQIIAAKAVIKSGLKLKNNFMIGATVDDEIAGDMGQKYMLESGLDSINFPKPTFHILGEATDLDIMVSFKGRIWFELFIKGKAAHGGEPFNGINSIDKTFRFYERLLSSLTENHELVGPTTLNFGTIDGGIRCNIVPEDCKSTFDLRMIPGETTSEWIDKIKEILESLKKEDPEFNYTKFEIFERRDPVEVNTSLPEIDKLKKVIEGVTGKVPKHRGTLSAGDLYHSLKNDLPGIWIGPGDPKMLHQTNERINVEDLMKACKIYALSIIELCL